LSVRAAAPADAAAVRTVQDASIVGLGPAADDRRQATAWPDASGTVDRAETIEPDDIEFRGAVRDTVGVGFWSSRREADELDPDTKLTPLSVRPPVARRAGTDRRAELEDGLPRPASSDSAPATLPGRVLRGRRDGPLGDEPEFPGHDAAGVTGRVVETTPERWRAGAWPPIANAAAR
jgi:hypothetical protein